jgi:hypothetical protein
MKFGRVERRANADLATFAAHEDTRNVALRVAATILGKFPLHVSDLRLTPFRI